MEIVMEIESLLDAIDREILLLDRVTAKMGYELDTRATQDMARWLSNWEPFDELSTSPTS